MILLIALIGAVIVAITYGIQESHINPPVPMQKVAHGDAAVDRETFYLELNAIASISVLNRKTDSREDELAKLSMPEVNNLPKNLKLVEQARKQKRVVSLPSKTPIEVIKVEGFRVRISDIPQGLAMAGTQIRVLRGPLKDFEGWVMGSDISEVPIPRQGHAR